MIKAVLFDLDDTLIDHDLAIRNAAGVLFDSVVPNREHERKVFLERWILLNREWYKQFYAQKVTFQESGRGKLRDAFFTYGYKFSVTDADALLSQYWECYLSQCGLFGDVSECFARLHGYKIGVVTNGQQTQQIEKLKRCGIFSFVDVVVSSEAAGFAKPAPKIFLQACTELGIQEKESIYVGDNLELDAIAARNIGLVGVWLDRHSADLKNYSLDLEGIKRINSLTELSEIINAFERQ
jgi:putative hydrolase of the HAD superfamily